MIAENAELRQRVDDLQRQLLRLQTVEGAFLRLGEAVQYARRSQQPLQLADVVYADYTSWLRSLLLYVGDRGGKVDQPVIDDRGLVGRVVAVGGGYAKVQMITDRTSAVGAMLERTSRQGVARGDSRSGLVLDYVPLQADVRPGDRVVTAGIDGSNRAAYHRRGAAVRPATPLFHHVEVTTMATLRPDPLPAPRCPTRASSDTLALDLR